MTTLKSLQQSFQNYVLQQQEAFLAEVSAPSIEFANERLSIYRDAYELRLLEALGKNFPMLAKWLGPDIFERLGSAYTARYPSSYFSVSYFGHRWAEFLAEQAQTNSLSLCWAEMAHFEWAINLVIESVDTVLCTRQDIITVPQEHWAELRLQFHPAVQALDFNWNIVELWQELAADRDITAIQQESKQTWVVWRKGLQAYFAPQTESEAWMLKACVNEQPFAEVCAGLSQWHQEEEIASFAVNLLLRWLDEGMITAIRTN